MRVKRAELQALGIQVTSRWLDEKASPTSGITEHAPSYLESTAKIDIADIEISDAVILFTPSDEDLDSVVVTRSWARGGRHFETGYAYLLGREIIVCGPRENIFHYLPGIQQFDTWEQTKKYMEYIQSRVPEEVARGGRR